MCSGHWPQPDYKHCELYISRHLNPICIHITTAGSQELLSLDLPICMPMCVEELYAWYRCLHVSPISSPNFPPSSHQRVGGGVRGGGNGGPEEEQFK